jgi:hypothetical protein
VSQRVPEVGVVNLKERLREQAWPPLAEVIIMPSLFWLALLLGYLTGVAAAVLLLPAPLIEPLYGPLVLTTVVVLAAFGALMQLRRMRRRARRTAATPRHEPPPGDHSLVANRQVSAGESAENGSADPDREFDDHWPLVLRFEPPGVIGPSELRQILYEGRVGARLGRLTDPAAPEAALYHALPHLRAADGSQLEPARYRTTAGRCGLLGVVDRLLLLRCAEMLRATRAEGREALVLCAVAAASLTDPAFVAEIEQQLSDHPALPDDLVLALDHAVHDAPSVAAFGRLRERGLRFCLRRVGPPPTDAAAELANSGFHFVLLEGGRFAIGSGGAPGEPALLELQQAFGTAGIKLLAVDGGADRATIDLPGDWAAEAEDGAFDLARPTAA